MAQTHAPGAHPLGTATVANFMPGQQVEQVVQMEAGRCYTILAAGVPTVQGLTIQLVPTMGPPVVFQQSQPTEVPGQAVLGKSPNCFKVVISAPWKVVTTVSAGQGLAAVQVYEK